MPTSSMIRSGFALVLAVTAVAACSELPGGAPSPADAGREVAPSSVPPTLDAGREVAPAPVPPRSDAAAGGDSAPDAASDVASRASDAGSSDAGSSDAGSSDAGDAALDRGAPEVSRADAAADGSPVSSVPDGGSDGPLQCLAVDKSCSATGGAACCAGLTCGTTSLGQVCCGMTGVRCATSNGEDCCGDLLCLSGFCGHRLQAPACASACTVPAALTLERQRLQAIGGSFEGICGDANHTYGYHVPAARLPASDYSLQGDANRPVCTWEAAAIDIGMDWPASRTWLRWLIGEIIAGRIKNVPEVIGSYDGVDVRYWSNSSGWTTNGIHYTGEGHDTWTHVSIYRSTTREDHHILDGWGANGRL